MKKIILMVISSSLVFAISVKVNTQSSAHVKAHKPVVKKEYHLIHNYRNSLIQLPSHKFYAGGYHFVVQAKIDDYIDEARIYFKDERSPSYNVYAKMNCIQNNCVASLPVSKPSLEVLEYFLVYKSKGKNLYKTSTLKSIKRDMLELPLWQRDHQDKGSKVYTEYAKPPKILLGFPSRLAINVIPRIDVFGVELGLYKLEEINIKDDFLNIDICNQCENLKKDRL